MQAGPLTDYLTAVGRGLDDVPFEERDELLDDVMAHLTEIASELGEDLSADTLRARLGTPQEYVAELRAAAGYRSGATGPAPDSVPGKEKRRPIAVLPYLLLGLAGVFLIATVFGGGNVAGFVLTLLGTVACGGWGAHLLWKRHGDRLTGDRRARVSLVLLVLSCGVAAAAGAQLGPTALSDRVLISLLIASVLALLAFWVSRADFAALSELPEVGRCSALFARLTARRPPWWPSVRPYVRAGWWALRGWTIAIGIGLLLGIGMRMLTVPQIATPGGIVGLVLIAGAVVGSIWVGKRFAGDGRAAWYVLPANALAIGTLWVMAMSGPSWIDPPEPAKYAEQTPRPDDAFVGPDGREIRNVFIFDAQGRPLEKVYLYDQKGRAIVLPRARCTAEDFEDVAYPGDNVFPRPVVKSVDEVCREVRGVPFTVAIPTEPSAAKKKPAAKKTEATEPAATKKPEAPRGSPSTPTK